MKIEYLWLLGAIVLLVIIIINTGKSKTDLSSITEDDILTALKDGHRVTAVKYYRIVHGVGLKEAKDAVDRMAKTL